MSFRGEKCKGVALVGSYLAFKIQKIVSILAGIPYRPLYEHCIYRGYSTSGFDISPRDIMSGLGTCGEGTCVCQRATHLPEGEVFARGLTLVSTLL